MNKENMVGKYPFEEITLYLQNAHFIIPPNTLDNENYLYINALNVFMKYYKKLCSGIVCDYSIIKNEKYINDIFFFYNIAPLFLSYGLIQFINIDHTPLQKYQITQVGIKLYQKILNTISNQSH